MGEAAEKGKGKGSKGASKGEKRPYDQTPEDAAERKAARKEATALMKAKRREENAEKREEMEALYDQIMTKMAPLMASVVDTFGGVATVNLIMNDAELCELVNEIPHGYPKHLRKIVPKIVEMFPEYIVMLEGDNHHGFIATALGYENRIVSPDGVVDKAVLKEHHAERDPNCRRTLSRSDRLTGPPPPRGARGYKPVPGVPLPKQPQHRLNELAKALSKAATMQDHSAFEVALKAVHAARGQVFGGYCDEDAFEEGGACYEECQGKPQKAFLEETRRIMTQERSLKGGESMKLIEIASNRTIKTLFAKIITGPKKMSKIIDDCEWFNITRKMMDSGRPELYVTLTDQGAHAW